MIMVQKITRHSANYYSDGMGVLIEDAEAFAPPDVLRWFKQCMTDGPAQDTLTYLASDRSEYGIMTVSEYEKLYFNMSPKELRKHMNSKAETLSSNSLLAECAVYAGHGTGISECDELCIFIPATTDHARVREIISLIEQTAYHGMDQSQEPQMGGMA